jgi:uncharacterized protein YbcV (DUF1398 family)
MEYRHGRDFMKMLAIVLMFAAGRPRRSKTASIRDFRIQESLNGTMTFPQVVGKLLEQGVESYHVDLTRSENRYYDAGGESAVIEVPHRTHLAAADFSPEGVHAAIRKSQAGEIKYPRFLEEISQAGCVYYIAYLAGKQVIYFGRKGEMHVEKFPQPGR